MIVKYDIPLYKCENSFGDRLSEIMKKYDYEMVMGNFRNDFIFIYTKTEKHKYEIRWDDDSGLRYCFYELDKIEDKICEIGQLRPPHWYDIIEDLNKMILKHFEILDTLSNHIGFKSKLNIETWETNSSIGMDDIKDGESDYEKIREWLEGKGWSVE